MWFSTLANEHTFPIFISNFPIEFFMPAVTFSAFLKECVKRRSLESVKNNPYCSETAAKDAIEAVWNICYNDTRPFDRAP